MRNPGYPKKNKKERKNDADADAEIAPTARAMTGSRTCSLSVFLSNQQRKRERNKLWQFEATPSELPLDQPITYHKVLH